MSDRFKPLTPKDEDFLKDVTKDFGHKPSILQGAIERITENMQKRQEIESLPEPERTFRIMAYDQTNITFGFGRPSLKKYTSQGVLTVIKSPTSEKGYMLGFRLDSQQLRDELRVPPYKDMYLKALVENDDIVPTREVIEEVEENVVSRLFVAVLTPEDKKFLIENTSRIL